MRREHARLVGRIIFCNLLEYPLERYKKMIEEVEASPLMSKVPVTVSRLSQTRSDCPGEKGSARVVAEIVKNGQALAIRYTYEGFNRVYVECGPPNPDCGVRNEDTGYRIQDNKSMIPDTKSLPASRFLSGRRQGGEVSRLLHKLRRISSRNELTHQVLRGIIEQQGEYLRTGNPLNLQPLTQVDLAKAISNEKKEVDNSWISRVISGLAVLTPSGMEKPLKFFFPTGKQVNKYFIKDLVDKEREDIIAGRIKTPYSDEQISDILPFPLSRRSVAQCRKEMGIPPAKRRLSDKYAPLMADFSMLYLLTLESIQTNAPASPGIYEFRLKGKEIEYPNGKTPILYIGSTRNIKKRLRDHLGKNTKNGRIREFLKNHECLFRYVRVSKDWRKEEARRYQLFFTTYGTSPKCNRLKPGGLK